MTQFNPLILSQDNGWLFKRKFVVLSTSFHVIPRFLSGLTKVYDLKEPGTLLPPLRLLSSNTHSWPANIMKLQLETAGTERKTKLTVTVICHSLQQWYNLHHVWHLTNVEGIFLSRARPRKITLASVFASEIEFVKKYLDYPAKVRFLIPLGTKMKAH